MENAIKYYYNISATNIEKKENGYVFKYIDEIYYLQLSFYEDKRIKQVYELNKTMINNNILIHEILLNIFNQVVTVIDNKPYILMRINSNLDKKIDLKDISYFQYLNSNLVNNKELNNWSDKWVKKIDYYEQQAIEIGKKYPIAMETFNYFVGMAENAITYINNNNLEKPTISYCHIRIGTDILEFYNPFNLIVDYKVRDFCEYVKFNFFYHKLDYDEIKEYIINSNLNSTDIKYLYSRMLFPTYYFDIFEKVMENLEDEVEIIQIVNKMKDYEKFLYYLCKYLNKFTYIEEIEWIKKAIN